MTTIVIVTATFLHFSQQQYEETPAGAYLSILAVHPPRTASNQSADNNG
jgi:hypothetical protein